MSLSELERHILAYFVAVHAAEFNIANRFYPYGELVLVWEDKLGVATRKFGARVRARAKPVATAWLDLMIERGAYSSKANDFGGTMHSFQAEEYRRLVGELKASDPLIRRAEARGGDFWEAAFAELTRTDP